MSSFNKVVLMGNLTRNPELRFTKSQTAICKFGMAINRKYKTDDGEWKEETTFVDVTIFGKRGEAFEKYNRKGSTVLIEGELRMDEWNEKDTGHKRTKLFVVAENWEFCGGKGGGAGQTQQTADYGDDGGYPA